MKRFLILFCLVLFAFSSTAFAQNRSYTIEDVLKVRRVSDPQISPDGRFVAFTIGDVNFDANRIVTHIYVVPVAGGDIKQLTVGDRSATSPRWCQR